MKRWQVHLAVILGLLALLTLLFVRAGVVSPDAHYRYLENLRSLHQADVEANATVLATHAELIQNYDAMMMHSRRARQALKQAANPPDFLGPSYRSAVLERINDLSVEIEHKIDLIEHYKRANSIFRNSADYFPKASDEFLLHVTPQRRLDYYGPFIRDMLEISRSPTPELIATQKNRLTILENLSLPSAERERLDLLLLHARVILEKHPEVDSIVREVVKMPTELKLEALMKNYTDGHEESLRIAGYFRILLFMAALLLVAYVAYASIRIGRDQIKLAGANRTLTERFEALRRAEQQTRLYSSVFTNASEGMIITDAKSLILAVNPAFCSITGYSPEEVMGQIPSILNSGKQDQSFYAAMWETLKKEGKWNGEIWNRRKDGAVYPEWLSITAVHDDNGSTSHYIGIFTDITKRKHDEERIQHLAHHDPLTGLPNRLLLEDRIEQAILKSRRSGKHTAIMFLDLDRFKNINDTLGHDVGDLLLIEAAQRGTSVLRETDTLSRLGGDEFIVVLPEIDTAQDAAQVARKLLQGISQPYYLAGHELRVTASLGIALCPDDGRSVSELLRNADTAMYRAKEDGRNLYCFYSADMSMTALGELLLESHLRTALDHAELILHYQPKFDAKTGSLVGAEALMRWQHPQHGLIPPGRFIPLAEECGLISALGEWALRTACRQQRLWLDAGLMTVPIAVNVSAQQFAQQNLPVLIAGILEEHGIPAELIDLELTESLLVRNASQTTSTLKLLRDMNISMAIDDFGTGYSSLSYLNRFPVQALKIDRAFVQDIDEAGEQVKLAPAIIALAHSMGMHVIAEGIETQAQADFLSMHECDQFQGYLYARPMPAEEFSKLIPSSDSTLS